MQSLALGKTPEQQDFRMLTMSGHGVTGSYAISGIMIATTMITKCGINSQMEAT